MRFGFIVICLIFGLVACEQSDVVEQAGGKVYPSAAYLKHFGEPPTPQQGYAYAQIGYLPLNDHSGQVAPIPLFLFNENQHLDRILSQLFSERLVVPSSSKLSPPFAQGVRLVQLDQAGDTLIVSLQTANDSKAVDKAGIDRAITETATQFEEVGRVRVLYNGEPSERQPLEGYQSRGETIATVAAPMLMDAIGSWEPGASGPEEVLINFDRPVTINSFRLMDRAGEQIGGKYYTSIFDMAVVVHPSQPEKITEGMVLNVAWDVDDALGRRNSGLDSLKLRRQEH